MTSRLEVQLMIWLGRDWDLLAWGLRRLPLLLSRFKHAVVVPQTSILQHDRYLVKVDPSPLRPHAGNHDMNLGQVHVVS